MRNAPATTSILIYTFILSLCASVDGQTLDPGADGGTHDQPPDSAIHTVAIYPDSERFALSNGVKRVPMSALSQWCTVPPEHAEDIVILTDPGVASSVGVSFVGIDVTLYGAFLAGFNKPAFLHAGANVHALKVDFDRPACGVDLGTVAPFEDYMENTLTLEHEQGMHIAIFNVTSTTADSQAQTVPRKEVPVVESTTSTSQPTGTPSTNDKPGSTPGKGKGVPLEAIVAPAVILGMCLLAGLVVLYLCVFQRSKLRSQKLYGTIHWGAQNQASPLIHERERDQTRVSLPPSLVGSIYSETRCSASSVGSTSALLQPYLMVHDSNIPDAPPKAALVDLANKRLVRPYDLSTPGTAISGSQHHFSHANPQKATLATWKVGHTNPIDPSHVRSAIQQGMTGPPLLVGEAPGAPTMATHDSSTLEALERAARRAGFSMQALLESLNRVRQGRARGTDSENGSVGVDDLPRYRL